MTAPASHAGVHHGVGGEGGGPRGDGSEVGDQAPGVGPAALWALGELVGCAHRAHQLEPLLAIGALIFVESHKSHLSIIGRLPLPYCNLYGRTVTPAAPNGAQSSVGDGR